ncbi:sigma-54 dependent transcriptional regulator [Thiorhodococcus fuscus]|uniref:Sigma 54-interacting transcriptional regulator n=1 Tax=Thiorhodococcus fuscus TaxID=527200 RepID=A0ABW4Y6M1_9GAMM
MRKLLVVSQAPLNNEIAETLKAKQWDVHEATDPEAARQLAEEQQFLVALAIFPEKKNAKGEERIRELVTCLPEIKWVAALAEQQIARHGMKHFIAERLYDFHVFPLEGDRISTVLGHAFGMAQIEQDLITMEPLTAPNRFGLIGESEVMLALYRMLQRAAESDVPVLITGPTGTGKELAARAIHDHSSRSKAPYVAINCAAIPPSLLQSELFGHEKGSFTSANNRKTGYIQSASGGTLFLDEIGDMPLESQATLLRFLEDKIVTPIGATRGVRVDVRVIASTNVDLEQAIQNKAFRADLYYRLAFLTIQTPNLNQREHDIQLLASYFLEQVATEAGIRNLKFSNEAIAALRLYHWPGNVRELRSVIFQAALSCDGTLIRPEHMKIQLEEPLPLAAASPPPEPQERHAAPNVQPYTMGTLKNAREQSEKHNLEFALARNASNVTRTAQELGVSRMTLYRLMAKHGVARNASN